VAALAAFVSARALSIMKSWMMPRVASRCDIDPGFAQVSGVALAIIPQDITFSIYDERLGKALELLAARVERAGSDEVALIRIGRVLIPEPLHPVTRQPISLGELGVRAIFEVRVGYRVTRSP